MVNFATNMDGVSMVVVFPRGQLSAEDKERLSVGGVIAVEADNPSQVSMLTLGLSASNNVWADDLFMAALKAVKEGGEGSRFAAELFRRMEANELRATP